MFSYIVEYALSVKAQARQAADSCSSYCSSTYKMLLTGLLYHVPLWDYEDFKHVQLAYIVHIINDDLKH